MEMLLPKSVMSVLTNGSFAAYIIRADSTYQFRAMFSVFLLKLTFWRKLGEKSAGKDVAGQTSVANDTIVVDQNARAAAIQ